MDGRSPRASPADDLAALNRRIDELAQAQRQRAPAPTLPEWPAFVRGAPNAFLRSALFAAVQGKTRKVFRKRVLLASTENCEIRFQGVQLDQSDFDVWMQILHLGRHQLAGLPVTFSGHELLTMLQRGTGKGQYLWLEDSIARLGGALVELTFLGRHTFGDHLLRYYRDQQTQRYVVELTEDMVRLFALGYTYLEWAERRRLMRKPLTLWLHGFFCSHAAPYPIRVATLCRLSGSATTCLRGFKSRLQRSLQELTDLGVISHFEISADGLLTVTRPPTTTARRLPEPSRR